MKILTTLAVAAAFSTPVAAQALNEPFDTSSTGVFPPAGWAVTLLPAHTATFQWQDAVGAFNSTQGVTSPIGLGDAAGHGYGGTGVISDDRLESPELDLSAYGSPQLVYDGVLGWAAYMSHTGGNLGKSDIEVSTDQGATWTVIWSEAATADYYTAGITEDLSAYANNSSVTLGFRYQGEFAHEWGLDNVVVDNGGAPTGPGLAIIGTAGGSMTFDFSGCTPGGSVAVVYGPAGVYNVPGGPCAGLVMDLLPANFPPVSALITLTADASGNASLSRNVPAGGAGLTVQGVDVATCAKTNASQIQ